MCLIRDDSTINETLEELTSLAMTLYEESICNFKGFILYE